MLCDSMFYFMSYVMPFMSDTLNRGSGMVGLIVWFNPPKPGPQSMTFCGTLCTYQ